MKKAIIFLVVAIVALAASLVMYQIGTTSSHLSELADYYFVPIPLGIICLVLSIMQFSQNQKGNKN